jgi:phosphatidylglycerol:prolipoprotein diacylglycerol transferase
VPASRRVAIIGTYAIVFLLALPLFLTVLGARLDALFRLPRLGPPWRVAGASLAALGLGGLAWTMLYLGRAGRGWPISHLPTKHFVATGPYRVVRHPIYVAYTLAFVGLGLTLGSAGRAFCAGALLLVGWLVYALGFEEPKLVRRFGDEYISYRAVVPVLRLPGRRPARRLAAEAWVRAGRLVVEWIANRVVLFKVGPTIWVTYGALLALGVIAMVSVTGAQLLEAGRSVSEVTVYEVWVAASMLLGGRLIWLAYQAHRIREDPVRVFRTVGFVSWGAVLACVAVPLVFTGLRFEEALWLLDRTLLGLVVGAVFGRVGCLTYGCCYGKPSPWGVRWTHPDAKVSRELGDVGEVPRVPTQLLESVWLLAVLALVVVATSTSAPSGTVAGLILVLYGVGRFAIDCLREEVRFCPWRLTSGQIGSLVAGSFGFGLLFVASGPPGWSEPALRVRSADVLRLWPAILASGLLVFLVAGLHWRRVGRW